MKLLIVEDEQKLLDILNQSFQDLGALVDCATNGEQALISLTQVKYDVVILDLGLPQLPGIEVLKRVRASGLNQSTPILILSARNSWQERVQGLQAGADDYLGKPFEFEELNARLLALFRRSTPQPHQSMELSFCNLTLNLETKSVTIHNQEHSLTKTEFRLLEYFMRHPNKILSKDQLIERISDHNQNHESNVIEVYIRKLRKKIGSHLIETHRGLGYKMTCNTDS